MNTDAGLLVNVLNPSLHVCAPALDSWLRTAYIQDQTANFVHSNSDLLRSQKLSNATLSMKDSKLYIFYQAIAIDEKQPVVPFPMYAHTLLTN